MVESERDGRSEVGRKIGWVTTIGGERIVPVRVCESSLRHCPGDLGNLAR